VSGHVRRSVLIVIMLMVFAATYLSGEAKGLSRAMPERVRTYGVPIAVSMDLYGLKGYVAYYDVARRFANAKPIDVILSEDLPRTSAGTLTPALLEHPETLFFIPADDKGDVTYTRLAFRIFGQKQEALYRLYFVLLLGSIIAFSLVFYTNIDRLLIGVCVMLSMLTLLSAFQDGLLRPHVVTFYDPRIYGVVAALAMLHLGFAVVDDHRISPLRFVCAVYQVFMIVLAVHVRLDNLWLVFALFTWAAIALVVRTRRDRSVSVPRSATATGRMLWRTAWPVLMLAPAFCAFLMWERLAYHPKYFGSNMAHHLLWHNVGLGFALHPSLGAPFDYQGSDGAMMRRVVHYLFEHGQQDTIGRIFDGAYSNTTGTPRGADVAVDTFLNGEHSDLRLYNDVARQLVVETALAQPLQTASLVFYYKPRFVLSLFLWYTAFLTHDPPSVGSDGRLSPLVRPHGDSRVRHTYFSPLQESSLAILAIAAAMAWPIRRAGQALTAPLLMLVFSLMPSFVAYPAPFLMGASLFALGLTLHVALIGLAVAAVALVRRVIGPFVVFSRPWGVRHCSGPST
jgi:hypothetical protein